MLAFLVRRLILVIPVLFGLLLLTFIMMSVIPADPAAALAGENATPEQIAQIRALYGFDKPFLLQFWNYLGQIFKGDFGISAYSNRPISADIFARLPATIELTLSALLVSAFFGLLVGALAAVWHNSWADHLIRLLTVTGLAIASFWFAIMLQIVFAMDLGWLPLRGRLPVSVDAPAAITGFYLIDSLLAGDLRTFWLATQHLVLPATTLAFGGLATIARFTRSSLIDALQSEYVTYQRAMGVPGWRVVFPYALRNSLVSPLNQIGLLFGSFISGAVVVEAIFDWPGLGSYLVDAILTADYKAILAVTLVVGVIYAIVNIIVDLLHGIIDPRIAEDM